MEELDLSKVDEIIDYYEGDPSLLLSMLQDVQAAYRYLPREVLIRIRKRTGVPLPRIYAVATFYKSFSLEPRGKHLVQVCTGTACHVRGAPRILEEIKRCLQISSGETTKDLLFTLETVNCLGACALGPLAVIDGKYYGKLSPAKVKGILDAHRDGADE